MKDSVRGAMLPEPFDDSGVLYLAPPRAHTLNRLKSFLGRIESISYAEPAPGLLSITLTTGLLDQLADLLPRRLSAAEIQNTRSLVMPSGVAIELSDLASMQSLETLIARISGRWLQDMIGDGRLVSHFQPIVHARQPYEVYAYECLLRGVDLEGILVEPDRMYQVARKADLLFALDQSARLTAIRLSAEFGLDEAGIPIFVNFNPSSVYNPTSCCLSTIVGVSRTVFDPDRIVFEIVDCERIEDVRHLKRIVRYFRDAGFRVALDDVGSSHLADHLIEGIRPDFIKLSMQLVRGVDQDPDTAEVVRELIASARRLDIETVAAGVETEGEWAWLKENGADYVQGYLLARPGRSPARLRGLADRWRHEGRDTPEVEPLHQPPCVAAPSRLHDLTAPGA